MVHLKLEKQRLLLMLKLLSLESKQPVFFIVKNKKIQSRHYIRNGYKMVLFKTPFFTDISDEDTILFNTLEFYDYIRKNFRDVSKKELSLDFDYMDDKININTHLISASYPTIIGLGDDCDDVPISFKNGYPIVNDVLLDTHIIVKSKEIMDFSRCYKKNKTKFSEFELKNGKFLLHLNDTRGNYQHMPFFNVIRGNELSIKLFQPFMREMMLFNNSKNSFLHIYAKDDYPIWFCEETKEYAVGLLLNQSF